MVMFDPNQGIPKFNLNDHRIDPATGLRAENHNRDRLTCALGGVARGGAWAAVSEVFVGDIGFTLSSGVLLGVVAYNQLRGNKFSDIFQEIKSRIVRK